MIEKIIKNPYILTCISSIMCVLAFPPFNLSFMIWFALVPFLYSLTVTPFEKKEKYGIIYYDAPIFGFLFGIIFYYGTLYWIFNVFDVFGLILLLVLCVYPFCFSYLLSYIYNRLGKKYLIILLPAILWTAIEYFKSEGWFLKFSWMNLGYSQHNFLPALQFGSLFGQYGITALILLFNSLIVYILVNRNNIVKIINSTIVGFLIAIVVLSYGYIQLNANHSPDIKVALVQDESSDYLVYEMLISKIIEDVDFILLPEYALPEYLDENSKRLKEIKNITDFYDSYLIVGSKDRLNDSQRNGYHNTAFLFNPEGEIIGKYYKMNPIQFFNDGEPGTEYSVFETIFGRIGIFICYDMDYSYVARNIVKNGADLLFIPTYDAMSWSEVQHEQHSAMTSMRAVENGRFIARATTSGISQIIDSNGRILQQIGIGKSDIIIGSIQKYSEKTVYNRFGYMLPYFFIAISLLLLIYSFLA